MKMKWYWWAIIIAVVIISVSFHKKISTVVTGVWNDYFTNARIQKLHPKIREKAKAFIAKAASQGYHLRITSGQRTFQEQQNLYEQGRTKPGAIVTNAKPGQSFHNYGLAFDVVEIKDGKAIFENPNWPAIGSLGKSFGFGWGGDWKSFKDLPHFEYTAGLPLSHLLANYNSDRVDSEGYVRLS